MSENHTGLYICLFILIVLVAGCLIVLLYNSGVRLPERTAEEQANLSDAVNKVFTPEMKSSMRDYGIAIIVLLIATPIAMFVVSLLTYCRQSNNTDESGSGQ